MKETIKDIIIMSYQFLVGGSAFWVVVYSPFSPFLSGNTISPLNNTEINLCFPVWMWLFAILIILGIVALFLQRRFLFKDDKH